jgi:ribosomal protein S18 acetylase RimI-like enzyme
MDVGSLGFRTDLALLRLGGSVIEDHGDHLVVRTPHNPDFWWGNFLLLSAAPSPADGQRWLERFAAAFPTARHTTFGVDVADSAAGAAADYSWFAERGFKIDAAAVMTATAVQPPSRIDHTAAYRPLNSDDDWAQSTELRMRLDTEYEPVAHRGFVIAKTATNRALVEDGHGAWFGAFVDGLLVAQLGLVTAADGLARFQTVETDPAHRRRGHARALVHRASRFGFDDLGARTLVMVADPEYFAIDLYRQLGFAVTETQVQLERRPA